MGGSEPNAQPGSGLPPYDGTESWFEQLPIKLEETARLLVALAGPESTGPARPEFLLAQLSSTDQVVTLDDVIEWLLLLADLGFVRLFTSLGAERFTLSRNIPETHGKGEGGRARASEGAGERASVPPPGPRPPGRRAALRVPPRFCPEHMPYGTQKDCWACGRARETRAAVLEERRSELRWRTAWDPEEGDDDER